MQCYYGSSDAHCQEILIRETPLKCSERGWRQWWQFQMWSFPRTHSQRWKSSIHFCLVGYRCFISLKGKLWKDSSSPNIDVDFVTVVYYYFFVVFALTPFLFPHIWTSLKLKEKKTIWNLIVVFSLFACQFYKRNDIPKAHREVPC